MKEGRKEENKKWGDRDARGGKEITGRKKEKVRKREKKVRI